MKISKIICCIVLVGILCMSLTACECEHSWKKATCENPKTCRECGETKGEPLDHTWTKQSCVNPKTCLNCGAIKGTALGHSWQDATCLAPKTCEICGATEGDVGGHSWQDATCLAPRTCEICGATEGGFGDHSWQDASCLAPKTCKICGATEGVVGDHVWENETGAEYSNCKICGMSEADIEYVDPFRDIYDYDERSAAVYDLVLGDFYEAYQEAAAEKDVATRYAKMAIAEAKLLGAGIFLPTTSQGGNYAMTKVAPYTNSPVLYGNDTYRFHNRVVTEEPIDAAHIAEMKAKWATVRGTGTYEEWVKSYLTEKGYTIKDTANFYFGYDTHFWDILATSYSSDIKILVQTYDGLVEVDIENREQPALALSYTVSEDGLKYTFKLREGVVWVDNQGRKVADLTADDFVAGMQHMMDAAGGLEYLACSGCANIKNADEYIFGAVTDFKEVGIKAIDDYTLEYTLTEPTPYFPTLLTSSVFAPMSRSYYESMGGKFGEDFDDTADTYLYGKGPDSIAYCGPYVITSYTSNNAIVLEANESYWNADNINLKSITYMYTDFIDSYLMHDNFFNGVVDTLEMNNDHIAIAKNYGTFDKYAYISDTDSTTYCGFLNLRRATFSNYYYSDIGKSPKTEEEIERTGAAMLNQHFRLALLMSIDRGVYNAQSVGEEQKYNALVNSYTPGNFVNLPTEATISINGVKKTYPAGTMYGQIIQDQLDADGIKLTVWNGTSSAGFDGWYNKDNVAAEMALAIQELKKQGVAISAENPIYLDIPVRGDSQVSKNQKNAMKQSIEDATDGCIRVNLVEFPTRDDYLAATYRFEIGQDANYDLNDGSGWGPDYGDPSSYLSTLLPNYAGYMAKCLGIF